ncbi:apiosidase-like domain-containing protein [Flavilitoribacter nigricans]|uniref:DUF4038 domain-containing protein n=1 Tax=Flavilitoribacter nigricans (strain ATCC 23147 / DSM 23189 / NBRC 102662 / NCIMB 1420 / SS-2) TaxID=1122177 RepID=A0A2D0NBH3_FLAN2|nr:DUF4038 domain-containing protein [Flavilitoribacter nigricans]PHN05529.1 hypothetical protein CRP01_16180 [Flavilitoribacter nigricans DSM 23189 = NBRC 102662]
MRTATCALLGLLLLGACTPEEATNLIEVPQWSTYEITLDATSDYSNPYTEVELTATFTNDAGEQLTRPGFWDGGNTWKIRFAPPDDHSVWSWSTTASNPDDAGLHQQTGKIKATEQPGEHPLLAHGLLHMSEGKRNVVHQDGTPFLVVGDTPWAIPFRATAEQVQTYAADRQQKGFNAALLMSVQPDMKAEGPNARNTDQGFARGFADLSDGHLNELQPEYYQYLDTLIEILIDHEIVPVYQPVFHGFGWKGLDVLGNYVNPDEYVRYCRYLLARYGSRPAFWLLAGDNGGRDPGVRESGIMMEKEDCYQQPTGLHYNPCDDYVAPWAVDNPIKHCEHYNKEWQAEDWLDFQWAQTGHSDDHLYHKVERMYYNKPTKAVANGEPTYEGMNDGQNGLGWWQGEEAWMQLMSGGTMGVVYGAAALWQWKITADEAGWTAWASQNKSWREAMAMEGSRYVGYVSKVFEGMDFTDMQKRPDLTGDKHPLLAVEGKFYVSYLPKGGTIEIKDVPGDLTYRWFNPKTGAFGEKFPVDGNSFTAPRNDPWVLVIG